MLALAVGRAWLPFSHNLRLIIAHSQTRRGSARASRRARAVCSAGPANGNNKNNFHLAPCGPSADARPSLAQSGKRKQVGKHASGARQQAFE